MKKHLLATTILAGSLLSAHSAHAYDITIDDSTYFLALADVYGIGVVGGDDKHAYGRALLTGVLNHTLSNGLQIGANMAYEARTQYDDNGDNIGDGSYYRLFTGYGYISGKFGDIIGGKAYGAVSELVETAPSAIGINYGVNSPYNIHVRNPRFSPRSSTVSPDFLERDVRVGFYSPDVQGFRVGVTYAPELHDINPQSLSYVHWKNSTDIALVWKGSAGPVGIRLSAGYQQASADDTFVNSVTAGDPSSYAIGAKLSYKGLDVAGSYKYSDNQYGLKDISNDSYQIGALYGWSDYQISASYGYSEDDYPSVASNPFIGSNGGAISSEFIEVAASYAFNDHITLAVAAEHVNYEDNYFYPAVITNSVSNDGTYGVFQLHISY